LAQFLFAVDRGNPRVNGRFDELSVPMLRVLKTIVDAGLAHDKPVTLCGEMASKTLGAMALIALGYRSLSLAPSAIGPVKAMTLELDAGKAAAVVNGLIAGSDAVGSVRDALSAFAEAEGVPL
ncbi:MAG: peptidase, partial [Xanthobacteraceae bacterium]|nr:peptidase [Xanthobacteraceae bacterium]